MLAQEFTGVFPDAVTGSGEYLPGVAKTPANEILQVDTYPAQIVTIAAVQELAQSNAELGRTVELLQARLDRLESARGSDMGGSVLALLQRAAGFALVAGIGFAASGTASSAPSRFRIHASLAPTTGVQAGAGGIGLQAQLTSRHVGRAGGGYTLSGGVTQPQACTSDLVIMDGFDP